MKKSFTFLVILGIVLLNRITFAQNFDKNLIRNQLNLATKEATRKIKSGEEFKTAQFQPPSGFISGVSQNIQYYKNFRIPAIPGKIDNNHKRSYDTFWVATDTTITGTWTHNGPVIIVYNGILRFKNMNATIYGDIILWSIAAKLFVDSSYLYFPQDYFYQRSLVSIMNGYVSIKNSTLNYSGLSHNLLAANNSVIEMTNVTNIGFTTNGVYGHPTIRINGSNQAGEYVITDSATLEFRNTHTILLWHQFPKTSTVDFSFPSKSDTVLTYRFNKTLPKVSGINYDIKVDTCYDLMWALMPSSGSDVTISNSKLRSIGLWFETPDSFQVSGLVDQTHYTDFISGFTDRNLHLKNTDVQTWSLYPMKHSILNVTGSIVGEIGLENKAKVTGSNFTVDGSGGYFWATDTTVAFVGFSTSYNDIRTDKNGIFVLAYSSLMNGIASALKNSVMLYIQSNMSEDPVAYDNGVVWLSRIDKPSKAHADDHVPVFGSVWIDHAGNNPLMKWGHYEMYYQKNGDVAWHKIAVDSIKKIRNDTLAVWNTYSLAPDLYTLKLVISDNNGFKVEAVKGINLLPAVVTGKVENENLFGVNISHISETNYIRLEFNLVKTSDLKITLTDISGRILRNLPLKKYPSGSNCVFINDINIHSGVVIVKITDVENQSYKLLKIKI